MSSINHCQTCQENISSGKICKSCFWEKLSSDFSGRLNHVTEKWDAIIISNEMKFIEIIWRKIEFIALHLREFNKFAVNVLRDANEKIGFVKLLNCMKDELKFSPHQTKPKFIKLPGSLSERTIKTQLTPEKYIYYTTWKAIYQFLTFSNIKCPENEELYDKMSEFIYFIHQNIYHVEANYQTSSERKVNLRNICNKSSTEFSQIHSFVISFMEKIENRFSRIASTFYEEFQGCPKIYNVIMTSFRNFYPSQSLLANEMFPHVYDEIARLVLSALEKDMKKSKLTRHERLNFISHKFTECKKKSCDGFVYSDYNSDRCATCNCKSQNEVTWMTKCPFCFNENFIQDDSTISCKFCGDRYEYREIGPKDQEHYDERFNYFHHLGFSSETDYGSGLVSNDIDLDKQIIDDEEYSKLMFLVYRKNRYTKILNLICNRFSDPIDKNDMIYEINSTEEFIENQISLWKERYDLMMNITYLDRKRNIFCSFATDEDLYEIVQHLHLDESRQLTRHHKIRIAIKLNIQRVRNKLLHYIENSYIRIKHYHLLKNYTELSDISKKSDEDILNLVRDSEMRVIRDLRKSFDTLVFQYNENLSLDLLNLDFHKLAVNNL